MLIYVDSCWVKSELSLMLFMLTPALPDVTSVEENISFYIFSLYVWGGWGGVRWGEVGWCGVGWCGATTFHCTYRMLRYWIFSCTRHTSYVVLRDAREASDAMVRNGQPLKAGLGRWTLGLLQKINKSSQENQCKGSKDQSLEWKLVDLETCQRRRYNDRHNLNGTWCHVPHQ